MNLLALAVFATMDEAAIDALKHAAAVCDPRYECGGVVRRVPGGGFESSALFSSKKPFGVDLGEFYGADVVADFHTHICSIHNKPFADFFSPADAYANQGLHTVGYMLSLCDWNIRRYDPTQDDRDDEEVDFTSGRVIYLTCGHIVGWAVPWYDEGLVATIVRRTNKPGALKLSVSCDGPACALPHTTRSQRHP
ncbi:MAG TPA: hypothetical protein VNY70_08860 [Steroidobacteraceae bacterium]|nr:hypothetical protein [Steroidobacteraceae bacterium]